MNKLIARISNGFGNQMFLYASAYAIAKNLNRKLELDVISGLESLKKKNINKKFKHFEPKYELDIFNISAKTAKKKYIFDTFFKNLKRKLMKFSDNFFYKNFFLLEHKKKNKITFYKKINNKINLHKIAYIEGYFECEKYFIKYKNDIIKEFSFKKKIICEKKYKNLILRCNSVSMAIRADRFNERETDDYDNANVLKSKKFEIDQLKFIKKSIDYFKSKISNPVFFIFSDNPKKIKKKFDGMSNIVFIDKFIKNKVQEDFYLMTLCKHFAVAPTTFHFWAAWLAKNKNKICLRPKNLNPSKNLNYWPTSWIKI